MNHIMHNISGMLATRMKHYKWFLDRLKALVHLLNDKSYCDRFLQTCLSAGDRVLYEKDFKHFSHSFIDWRWGNVKECCSSVYALRDALQFWDRNKFLMKTSADDPGQAEDMHT